MQETGDKLPNTFLMPHHEPSILQGTGGDTDFGERILNVPLAPLWSGAGPGPARFHAAIAKIASRVEEFGPDLIIVSAGELLK